MKIRTTTDNRALFWCPACDGAHGIGIKPPGPVWTWNGDKDKPTFSPSIKVTYNGADADTPEGIPSICHSFVRDGKIQYCSDSSHKLAGQTVELPDFD